MSTDADASARENQPRRTGSTGGQMTPSREIRRPMSSEDPDREGGDEPSEQRQLTLDEATAWDGNQCEAISVRYSRRCRHETLQAAMRFGRDGNGATVYVHTNTLPDWVPVAGEGRIVSTWSDGMHEVLEAAESLEEWTTAELAAQVSISERQVCEHLHRLVDRGVLDVEVEGRGYVWRDDGLHRVSEHGEVELAPVDVDDLSAENVAEVARSSTYTWDFRNTAADKRAPPENGESGHRSVAGAMSNGGDRPPDDPI